MCLLRGMDVGPKGCCGAIYWVQHAVNCRRPLIHVFEVQQVFIIVIYYYIILDISVSR